MEKPKGRLLIYWGCGERVRPGQPVVIDFESMMAGKMPPAFANVATDAGFVARSAERALTRFERRGQRLGHGVWDLEYRRTN